jgi:hypothetical protein
MHPSERLEIGIIERLHAERDAIDAGGPEIGEAAGFDAGRVGFGSIAQASPIASRIAPTVRPSIREGVPPPKKIEATVRPGASAARWAISRRKAAT